jgi:hypothetical protein
MFNFFSLRYLNVGNWRHAGQCKSEKRDEGLYESTGCISEEHRKNGWMNEDDDEQDVELDDRLRDCERG